MLPKPDTLNNYEHGKFVLSNLAAKRAKQLKEGAPALIQIDSNHPLTIALAEIAAGKIKPIMHAPSEIGLADELTVILDDMAPEHGMLLPALDETEVALVTTVGDDDHDGDHDEDVLSLADLVEGEEEEEEDTATAEDDDTLSLSDIAEQESADEEGDSEEA